MRSAIFVRADTPDGARRDHVTREINQHFLWSRIKEKLFSLRGFVLTVLARVDRGL